MGLRDDSYEWRCPQCGYPNMGRYCQDCNYDSYSQLDLKKLADLIFGKKDKP